MAGSTSNGQSASLIGLLKDAGRLAPKQLNDEIQLAVAQMKSKGIHVGIAAALAVVALVFVAFVVVALLVAGILALGLVVEPWLAALLVAAFFLVLGGLLGLIGFGRVKKAMPLVPEDAIRGFKHDLGVIAEGSAFDPSVLDEPKPEKEEDSSGEDAKEKKPKPEPVPYDELLRRSAERRDHLARLRDEIGPKVDVKTRAGHGVERLMGFASRGAERASQTVSDAGSAVGDDAARLVRERWQPLAVMGASLIALAVFLRRLTKG
ncbi:phage holin family protein [Zafaria sp. Z1313]|uniref:phage holin family protein n=1 Tax=unclassified Zafaria TaxID=2828765 RepID=UPI002E781D6A|nr:phage holin family protein [Zafaria sp. J156]MEE1620054.1 phage holin family protein [Zafaria sp. J156]